MPASLGIIFVASLIRICTRLLGMVAEAGLLAMGADRWGIPVFRIVAGMGVELQASGLCVQVVEARSGVRDRLRTEGVEQKLGGINRATSVADAVEAFQKSGTS